MSKTAASTEITRPKRARRPDLRVVPTEDIDAMEAAIVAEANHMRPAITRHSVHLDHLRGRRKAVEADRAALVEKKALVLSLVKTFVAAVDDEIADADAALALYSGVSGETD